LEDEVDTDAKDDSLGDAIDEVALCEEGEGEGDGEGTGEGEREREGGVEEVTSRGDKAREAEDEETKREGIASTMALRTHVARKPR